MEIAFRTRPLRSICEDPSEALQKYRPEVVEALIRRLGDLRAASSPLEIFTGNPRFDARHDQMTLQLSHDFELILRPNHANPRRDENDNLDWGRVRRVQVVSIGKATDDG